jgi:exopolyphosphatase/guanosine-5'-triphosphate,3'-diphosphate pyrophosphatase
MIAGLEEGRLSYAGATADLEPNVGDDVAIDIGGGSTEIVLSLSGEIDAVSLDIGCVRLTERYLHADPPTGAEVDLAISAIKERLDVAIETVPGLGKLGSHRRLLGLAGTVSTLAMLDQGLDDYDRAQVHHYLLSLDAVERWVAILVDEDSASTSRRRAISPGREDVIAGGSLILRESMRRFGFKECLCSEADILDGIVASILG